MKGGNGPLWRYAKGNWKKLSSPNPQFGFGAFAISKSNPQVIVAAVPISPQAATIGVFKSDDGGAKWGRLPALDTLMVGGSPPRFASWAAHGPSGIAAFEGYWQPSLLAFDPADENTIVAGAMDAGVFLSRDGGRTWTVVTDNSSNTSPIIPRPILAAFAHHGASTTIYVGTQGRGVWRIRY